MDDVLLVNFGGPRNLEEIPSFLTELLCDRDVIRTKFPQFFHEFLFKRIAKKRALQVKKDYELIGGKSPIYFDTEEIAKRLRQKLNVKVITFHRYLKATHQKTFDEIQQIKTLTVLPLFPQYCSATTGSIYRFFSAPKFKWIKSYATHPAFIAAQSRKIATFLEEKNLKEEETFFLFSAHGVPKSFIDEGDVYESECNGSFREVMKGFPKAKALLCYQSKFGKGQWLTPYTNEVCENISHYAKTRKNILVVPISFTTDHIETLFEIEKLYLPLIERQGLFPFRCPALNLEPYWIDAIAEIVASQ